MTSVPPIAWSLLRRWRANAKMEDLARENGLTTEQVRDYIMQALRNSRSSPDVRMPKRISEVNVSDTRPPSK